MHTNFLTAGIIILFYYYKKVFILINVCIIGKNSIKYRNLKRNIYSHLNMEDITDTDYTHYVPSPLGQTIGPGILLSLLVFRNFASPLLLLSSV